MKLLLLAVLICCLSTLSWSQAPAYDQYEIKGVDVSKWNGQVNWPKVVEEGYTFTFIRASQGKKLKDPLFDQNWEGAKSAGLICGAYHFYVTTRKGKAQARRFMRTAEKWKPGDLPPVLDIERMDGGTPEEMVEQLKKWIQLVEKKWRVRPLIYTNENFYKEHLNGHFDAHAIWIARFRKKGPDMKDWTFWQYTDKGTVNGIEGNVDQNCFYGDSEAFRSITVNGLDF